MASLPDIARATVRRHDMLPEGSVVLAMVSGGADSTSLLRLLHAGGFGALDVRVLHVNHLLRGADSDADAAFVEDLCERLAVPCRVVRYDVSAYAAEEGLNLEDAGRRVRYRFADEELDAAAGPGEGRIAVAHTLDDNAETFLMRVLTGAGAGGLAAIPPVRGRIVRPLLDARRADVVEYLRELAQEWREDATNADTSRLRARIRHEVVPALEAVDPRFPGTLGRSLALLADDDALLAGMAEGFADAFGEQQAGGVSLDLALMRTLSRAMARRVVRTALLRAFPDAARLEASHVDAVVDGLASDAFARDLPFGLRAFVECGRMFVSRQPGPRPPVPPALLDIPGTADLGEAGSIDAEETTPGDVLADPSSAVIDAGRIDGPLVVDGPHEGDRIRPLGMTGTKKLSDLLQEAEVPRRERAATPVVRNGKDVVWVAGVRMSEDYRVTASTTRAVRLSWRR
ncbi:MAG TPA: tRNA lysidine(34) synthetase TilS [Coriobacteriia bacterium]|jgi:tRNA(Ile)-lysidine synthase